MVSPMRNASGAPIITLLTDFGSADAYVAAMKGVILGICPDARIVDITHEVPKFDVRWGAFLLSQAAPHFPSGTIHVAVVDPGVGTARRPIIVEAERCLYVGPDNGVLMLAAMQEGVKHVYVVENRRYMLPRVSRTFHGRDIFAPAAAHLALGVKPSEFGREVRDYVTPNFASPRVEGNAIVGEVIHVDGFGNIITNISEEHLNQLGIRDGDSLEVRIGGRRHRIKLCSAYGEAPVGATLAVLGNSDLLEVSINQGNAARTLGATVGMEVRVAPSSG